MSGAAGAAAAAAARKREEEEDMTQYNSNDMNGWEFKIVRSALESFKTHEAVKQVCKDEAQTGWEMVEKFDNGRIRFKRRIEERQQDTHRSIDPYRTSIGLGQGGLVVTILGIIFTLVGVGVVVALSASGKIDLPQQAIMYIVLAIIGVVALVAVIGRRARRRR